MAKRDYYDVLGVSKTSTSAEIKKSYRRLAMKYHPDRNTNDKDAEKKFKETREAYGVLSDTEKRSAYDKFGHEGLKTSGTGFTGSDGFGDIFGDVFGDIFGGSNRRRNNVYKGADLRYELKIDFELAINGGTVTIEYSKQIGCDTCDGSGAAKGSGPVKCNTCNGIGQVRMQQGFFSIQQTCSACQGSGKIIIDPCMKCHGNGLLRRPKKLEVKVPAGVDNGDRMRLSGEGDVGKNSGPSGDLYVEIIVNDHNIFERNGSDLSCQVPISMYTATLGGEVDLPTLNGTVSLKVPAGTQSGKLFRLRGKGVTTVRDHRIGDLFAKVLVETPVNLTSEQKNLLKEFYALIDQGREQHSPRKDSWAETVKRFFERIGV